MRNVGLIGINSIEQRSTSPYARQWCQHPARQQAGAAGDGPGSAVCWQQLCETELMPIGIRQVKVALAPAGILRWGSRREILRTHPLIQRIHILHPENGPTPPGRRIRRCDREIDEGLGGPEGTERALGSAKDHRKAEGGVEGQRIGHGADGEGDGTDVLDHGEPFRVVEVSGALCLPFDAARGAPATGDVSAASEASVAYVGHVVFPDHALRGRGDGYPLEETCQRSWCPRLLSKDVPWCWAVPIPTGPTLGVRHPLEPLPRAPLGAHKGRFFEKVT